MQRAVDRLHCRIFGSAHLAYFFESVTKHRRSRVYVGCCFFLSPRHRGRRLLTCFLSPDASGGHLHLPRPRFHPRPFHLGRLGGFSALLLCAASRVACPPHEPLPRLPHTHGAPDTTAAFAHRAWLPNQCSRLAVGHMDHMFWLTRLGAGCDAVTADVCLPNALQAKAGPVKQSLELS